MSLRRLVAGPLCTHTVGERRPHVTSQLYAANDEFVSSTVCLSWPVPW